MQYLIKCRSRKHQVAIDRRRFWQPARCPVCKTPIDPWRRRRFWWWLTGRGPKSRVRLGPFGEFNPIEGSLFLWLLVCIGVASVMWGLGDSWWVGTALLFAGRWPWMVPVVPLGLAALLVRRRTGIGLALANVLVVLFPIMGFSLGLGRFATRGPALGSLRIISYNMAGRAVSPIALSEMIHAWSPDVVAIQECGPNAAEAARLNPSYRIHESSICLISRLPIDSVYLQPRRDIEEIGGSGQVVRYRIRAPFGSFDLTNVHLETPREGLAALAYRDLDAGALIDKEIFLRDVESNRARRWVDSGGGPRLVAGDFNTPVESVIFRNHWGDLTEVFERVGFGLGHTKQTTLLGIRIDHILVDQRWVVRKAQVLPDYGSDHLPLMADLDLVAR